MGSLRPGICTDPLTLAWSMMTPGMSKPMGSPGRVGSFAPSPPARSARHRANDLGSVAVLSADPPAPEIRRVAESKDQLSREVLSPVPCVSLAAQNNGHGHNKGIPARAIGTRIRSLKLSIKLSNRRGPRKRQMRWGRLFQLRQFWRHDAIRGRWEIRRVEDRRGR